MELPVQKQVDLRAILDSPEWRRVASRSTQHMRWPAKCRLRMTSWYTFHVTFPDNADEALPAGVYDRRWEGRPLEETLRSQIQRSYHRPQEHVAD